LTLPFDTLSGCRVLVTGHTGFKGGWLCLWLAHLGADVTGFSLKPDDPSLFDNAEIGKGMRSVIGDVRDRDAVAKVLREARPQVIFHLAAQSLVRRSYGDPVETFETNVMGTVNLLDAARNCPELRAVINVTSDKCYENDGAGRAFVEGDPMGGHDPYSASKGAAEIVATAMSRSFLAEAGIALASVRAGNVIGGGDWSVDRIIPDIVRAALADQPVAIRRPDAVRPWQHVLEPLNGYLMLAEKLVDQGTTYSGGWNFGPDSHATVSVREIADAIAQRWSAVRPEYATTPEGPHEASVLRLDCTKAKTRLGWAPKLSLNEALDLTVDWYAGLALDPASARRLTLAQIDHYSSISTSQTKAMPT
jgi:CDP-glucose 4,6-dehydratase